MADLTPPTGRVHWIGTGMSTGSGLRLVCDGTSTILWGRTVQKAKDCLARLGLTEESAEVRAFDTATLASDVAVGDVVVSMLPASEHPRLVELALEHQAHFVCSSYVSPGISAHADTAREHGLVILTEIGVDPGIDHLLARELVRRARSAIGDRPARVRFTSYCGSNPAVPNEFRYRFSWAPRGVLTALLTPARVIGEGAEKEIPRPWESVTSRIVGEEKFEAYPNRDSLPFIQTYAFPPAWTIDEFVRGTLRLDGWSHAWKQVFAELVHADDARISELAEQLAITYPTTPSDRDRLVMSVRLELHAGTGNSWTGEYALDAVGDEHESATPRLVSVPLACGILDVVGGNVTPGLHQAADDPELVVQWLEFLRGHGIAANFRGNTEAV